MTQNRGSWYLLTGALIGLMAGIFLSLVVFPVRYTNTDPSSLREKDRRVYRAVIAQAYLAEGDIFRALSRLGLMQEATSPEIIVSQAQNMLAKGESESDARALALMAAAMNAPSLAVTPLAPLTPVVVETTQPSVTDDPSTTETASAPTATRTPGPTSTPRSTQTPLPTAGLPFALEGDPVEVCDPLPGAPLLMVTVLDASGQPVSGVKIEISQTGGGSETFFTGLYPKISRGYADYEMTPGMVYAIRVGDSGQPVSNLFAPACEDDSGNRVYGGLELEFRQP